MPKMEAFISGAWRTPARGEVLIGGAWRRIVRAEVYLSGAWKSCLTLTPALTVAVSPTSVSGTQTPQPPRTVTVTSNGAQATPTGGVGPYSYAWSITSGSATITSPNTAATAFRQILSPDQDSDGSAQVICTDSQGNTAIGSVSYYLYNRSLQ